MMNWTINDQGILIINGEISNDEKEHTWKLEKDRIKEIVIREGSNKIGRNAFEGCPNLTRVHLPKSLHFISTNAFKNCIHLQEVVVDQSKYFAHVYEHPFETRDYITFSLNSFLNVPWARKYFGDYYCKKGTLFACFFPKKNMVIPNVKKMEKFSLIGIEADSIKLPETLIEMESFVFSESVIHKRIVLPDSLKKISPYTFSDVKVPSVHFPKHLPFDVLKNTNTKCKRKVEYPAYVNKYSLKTVKNENYDGFKQLLIRENKPIVHKNGTITQVNDCETINVGKSILFRLYMSQIVTGIKHLEGEKGVCICSFLWDRISDVFKVCQMRPTIVDGVIKILSESTFCVDRYEIQEIFGKLRKEEQVNDNSIRYTESNVSEEWFVSNDYSGFGCRLENDLLKQWRKLNLDIQFDEVIKNKSREGENKNMNICYDEKKKEAILRLQELSKKYYLGPKLVNYFESEKLYYSYTYSMDTINYDERYAQAVKQFEEEYNTLVYHAIEAQTSFGIMLSFLYVSDHKDEWKEERLMGDIILSYSFVVEQGWQRGEFGDIGLASPLGYLMRTM